MALGRFSLDLLIPITLLGRLTMSILDPHDVHHHKLPIPKALKILGALLVLTVLTVAVAPPVTGFDLGILNAFVAMLIATVKASLVLLYFMGLKEDDKLFITLFITSVFFLVVLWAFSILDIGTRMNVDSALGG